VEKIQKGDNSTFDPTRYPPDVKKIIDICGINFFMRIREPLTSNHVYVVEEIPHESRSFADVKMIEEVKVEESDNTCRACLQVFSPEELHFLDQTYVDEIQLRDIYKELVGCGSSEDESLLPASICVDCERLLLAFREFLSKCHSNEAHFLKMAKTLAIGRTKKEPITFDVQVMADSSYNLPDEFFINMSDNKVILETNVVAETVSVLPIMGSNGKSNRFECSECGRLITKRTNLVRHWRYFHKFSDDVIQELKVGLLQVRTSDIECNLF
jgi:hypothetical protein